MDSKKSNKEKKGTKHISANLPKHLVDYLDLIYEKDDTVTTRTIALIKVISEHKEQIGGYKI